MPEVPLTTPTPLTDFDKLTAKIDLLIQTQAQTNQLLAQVINNNIAHFNSLKTWQADNTNKVTARLGDIYQEVNNSALWLTHIDNIDARIQAANDLIVQLLNKPVEVIFPTIQIDAGNTLLQQILDELRAGADAGEVRYISASASTTATPYDFVKSYEPHHAVRGILVKNDGTTAINVSISSPDSLTTFTINSLEWKPVAFNRECIEKVFITAASGTPAYRMWYSW